MNEYSVTDEGVAVAVAAGVAVLDVERPDWVQSINLDDLDLAEPGYCVLAHVFDGYGTGLDLLYGILPADPTREHYNARDCWAIEHGFEISMEWHVSTYDRLQREWERVIESRRAQLTAQ